ncbi:hypothetical protein PISMIDRAFT_677134 [Pisolithus microcarpus 441]|uniref:Uncharacterized protein n=1 Tax=Pisolithus microcarpus 441 TaxID=765257 RepID=A0A0C9YKP3_9AGAM|nr:hypothetical protein PISMIDRAFT_677134 [Pisolithus microcarpus 441]
MSTVRTRGGFDGVSHHRFCRRVITQTRQTNRSPYAKAASPVGPDMSPEVAHSDTPSTSSRIRDSNGKRMSLRADRVAPLLSSTQVDTVAIDTLRSFLLQGSGDIRIYTANKLRRLYRSAEWRGQLGRLDSSMLSTLISIFGSLRIGSRVTCAYDSPLLSRVQGEVDVGRRSYSSFVLNAASLKMQLGMVLTDSDRFWLMRVALAGAEALISSSCDKASQKQLAVLINRARIHYCAIRSHSFHPRVHVPYLQALLNTSDPCYVEILAKDMSYVLRTHRYCNPKTLQVFYQLILKHGTTLSRRGREAVVSSVWIRLQEAYRACLADLQSESGGAAPGIDTYHPDHPLDVSWVARYVSALLFQPLDCRSLHRHRSWFMKELFTVLSPSQELSQRWMAMTLVALFQSCSSVSITGSALLDDGPLEQLQSPAAACWQVIFGLATVEKLLKASALSRPLPGRDGFRDILCALYGKWLQVVNALTVPRDIACAVMASFFKLASIVHDSSLVEGCLALCDLGMLWGPASFKSLTKHNDHSNTFMTAQYVAALLRLHGPNTDMVLRTINAISKDVQWQRGVLSTVVRELALTELELALAVLDIVKKAGLVIDAGFLDVLAASFTRGGTLEEALRFLKVWKSQLTRAPRDMLVGAIALRIHGVKQVRSFPKILALLVDAIAGLYDSQSPPTHLRKRLEGLLLVCCQHGCASEAVNVVCDITRNTPKYFLPTFFRGLCSTLLRHRQFKSAVKVLAVVKSLYPTIARQLLHMVANTATRVGATRVAEGFHGQLNRSTRLYLWYRAQFKLPSERSIPRNLVSLKLSSFLRNLSHKDPTFDYLFGELLKSGRVGAAKRIFAGVAPVASSSRRTDLGNLLLHGVSTQPTPRNRRRLRKLLSLIEDLTRQCGFQPDRVTVNIIIKAMISWRAMFDNVRLRALFNHLIRGGYPPGDYSSQTLPFESPSAGRPLVMEKIGLSSHVDFERHVKPLYRMFVKAFYVRGDIEAARRVAEILSVEERRHKYVNAKEREHDLGAS